MSSEKLSFDYSKSKTLQLKLSGDWQLSAGLPSVNEVLAQLDSHADITEISFVASQDFKWDSAFISLLLKLSSISKQKNIRITVQGLPPQVEKLLKLTPAQAEKIIPHKIIEESFLDGIGSRVIEVKVTIFSLLNFLGDIVLAFKRLACGQVFFRKDDFFAIVQRCGIDALGLVSLISILVGIILAFIGAIQLKLFGAQIYIADIVGIAMVRVMGAIMTAILMAGRTGASFAAELGIMQVNEEIDALKTLGVSPVEFLIMPRVLALVMMMPLLTIYADLMGIIGGFVISTGVLGLNPVEYSNHTITAIKLSNLWLGLIHSFVFGIIIAVAGCYRGMQCKRSSVGVGEATTSAVVTAITAIVIATAIITFVCQIIGV
ncbi:MAG: ABC transporter permease [Candidatus Omnitrophica bacterium]|nr:ABC transporter permease [Candidatus Omnitrophota bacterium]MBU1924100.1 ABC transporter permease [Candidatus Omnitrophota bacterium]